MTFNRDMALRITIPIAVVICMIAIWQAIISTYAIPQYILPGPIAVGKSLYNDWGTLSPALLVTTKITLQALMLALMAMPTPPIRANISA